MKKIFFFAAFAVAVIGCNNSSSDGTMSDDTATLQAPPADNTHVDMGAAATYQPEEGDVKWQNEKLLVYENGTWVEAEKDITLDDGTLITVKGDARNKDGKTITLKEGDAVKKTGRFFDKAGKAISDAWNATKEGVRNAGEAVKEGVEDAGKAVKDGADKAGKKAKELIDSVKN